MDINKLSINDNKKQQIEGFLQPVLLIDENQQLIASNSAFDNHPILSQSLAKLLKKINDLVSKGSDHLSYTAQQQEYVLTSLPMKNKQWMIRCDRARSTALATRYQNILTAVDQMSDAVIICDRQQNIDLMNENLQTVFPYVSIQQLEGRSVLDFVTQILDYIYPDQELKRQVGFRYVRKKLALKMPCNFSFSHEEHFLQYRDRITFSGERIGIFIDETAFKELNDQLEKAFQEATQLSLAKSNFMSVMSHEVRTPLNAMIGMLELCVYDEQLVGNEYISRIKNNADHLLNLINDVLDFTKFDADKVELNPTATDIRKLCEQLMEDFLGQAHSKNTVMSLFIDPLIPRTVLIDNVRLIQVLVNLLSNALKFNTGESPEVSVNVDTLGQQDLLRFRITDNGIGISKSQQEKIFTGFAQASGDIHRQFGGSGLGLSISLNICHLMGGQLGVESEHGKGSIFTFIIPADAKSAPEIDFIDSEKIKLKTVLTDNVYFFQTLLLYSQSLHFTCALLDDIPDKLDSNQKLIISESLTSEAIKITNPNQIAILFDAIAPKIPSDFYQIQQMPVKLADLVGFICAVPKTPTLNENEMTQTAISKQLRVLVVEDNKDNIFVLRRQFSSLGIAACFAMSAEDAVIFFEQQSFDIVLSDYQMPSVSGSELIKTLLQIEEWEDRPKSKKLILTADKSQTCHDNCMQAGADQVIQKPLTLAKLSRMFSYTDPIMTSEKNEKNTEHDAKTVSPDDEIFFYDGLEAASQNSVTVNSKFNAQALFDFVGDISAEEASSFLFEFCQNLKKIKIKMIILVERGQWDKLRKAVHSLKSSAMIVGAQELSSLCATLEKLSTQSRNEQQLKSAWDDVNASIEQLLQLLEVELVHDEQ
jgi:signal transduction histidine kinase/HPt (histidine-containing phosphotransfer) domain-containing protein/ActR/RegA family two-component response regulator